jgi:type I restriction enzyme, S subunit
MRGINMSFLKYKVYKDSGVEWLGEVPEHWTRVPMKHVAMLNPKKSDYQGDQSQTCSFVPMEKLKTGVIILDEERSISDVYGGYTYFENGDVLQAKVTPCFENKNIAIADNLTNGVGFGSSEINVLRASAIISNRFLYYRLQEINFMDFCISSMTGVAGLQRVPGDTINNFSIALPEKSEQTQIARFLDHETARIDALITEQQRLIELLKEKRQAVISHAVTKGLDPTAPLKDSGVEWLGEVPEHWVVGSLRWYASIQGGVAKGKDYAGRETVTLPYLRVANVQNGFLDLTEVKEIAVLETEVERYSLQSGDVLMNEGGDNDKLGRGTVWAGQISPCLHQNHVFAIRTNNQLLPKWLATFTQSQQAQTYFYLNSKQSTNLASISASNVMSLDLPLPKVNEQKQILEYLEKDKTQNNQLIKVAVSTVYLLQERRSALISAAVTGKIDVRGWQAPASASPAPTLEAAYG